MAFCTSCGAEVQGRFCVKCGAPAGGPAASPPPAQAAPPAAVPGKKKTSPLVWVLVAVVGLFVFAGLAVVGLGFFAVHKARQAGLDPDLMQRNPGLAVTKIIAAANPDIDVVRVDEGKGLITLREKSTGKVVTVDFEAVKEGRISFREEGKDAVTFEAKGSGDSGSLEIKSGKETMRFGAGSEVKIPSWIPAYPGATVEGRLMRETADGESGAFGFNTADPPKKVLEFYNEGFESAGLTITSQSLQMIAAEAGSRKATVMISSDSGRTEVAVTFENNK